MKRETAKEVLFLVWKRQPQVIKSSVPFNDWLDGLRIENIEEKLRWNNIHNVVFPINGKFHIDSIGTFDTIEELETIIEERIQKKERRS